MKPSSRASSKVKEAALNVKRKKTKKTSKSSAEETAKAITRARNKLPASRAPKCSSSRLRDNVAVEPAKLFWIIISNIHENVAYEDIVRALFKRCVELRSKGANPSNLGGHFQDTIEVAFKTKKDAKEAVDRFQNRIRLFRKIWRIHHHKPERSSAATSSSSISISDIQEAPESSDDELARLKETIQDPAVGTGDCAKVYITNIHEKVPREVVVPLFSTAGRVRSHDVHNNSDGVFQGTVQLEYEQREDAASAIRLFDDNITFFGKTWFVTHGDEDDEDKNEDEDKDKDEEEEDDDDDA